MNKKQLQSKTDKVVSETHDALQLVVDELNKGQKQKIIKNKDVKALLDRYKVDY